jgi:soluble lytic murein transglycosylase-like protein
VTTEKRVDIFDVDTNVEIGARILQEYRAKSKSWNETLLYYNGSHGSPNGYDKHVLVVKKQIETKYRI